MRTDWCDRLVEVTPLVRLRGRLTLARRALIGSTLLAGGLLLILEGAEVTIGRTGTAEAVDVRQVLVDARNALDSAAAQSASPQFLSSSGDRDQLLARIAGAWGRAGDLALARRTLGAIRSVDVRSRAAAQIAVDQATRGNRSAADQLLQDAIHDAPKHFVRDEHGNVSTPWYLLTFLGDVQVQVGSRVAARDTYRAALNLLLADPLDRTEVALQFERIAMGQTKAGDVAGARQTILRSLMDPHGKGQHFTMIARLQAEQGDPDGALATVEASPGTEPLRSVAIAWAQARAGRTGDALRTVDAIRQGHWSASADAALGEVASAQAERSDSADALQTLASIRNDQVRTLAATAIAGALIRAGDVTGAMKAIGGVPDSWRRPLLQAVAQAQAILGDVAGALKTTATLRQVDVSTGAEIADALAKAGDAAGALQLVDTLLGPGKVYPLIRVGVALADAGNRAGAVMALEKARQAATADGGQLLPSVAEAYAAIGDQKTAFEVADIPGALGRAAALPPPERAKALVGVAEARLRLTSPTKSPARTLKDLLR